MISCEPLEKSSVMEAKIYAVVTSMASDIPRMVCGPAEYRIRRLDMLWNHVCLEDSIKTAVEAGGFDHCPPGCLPSSVNDVDGLQRKE